jgi:hypothetical protein
MRNIYKIVVEKPEGKRPLGRPRPKCDDNIGMHLRDTELKVMEIILLAQGVDQ